MFPRLPGTSGTRTHSTALCSNPFDRHLLLTLVCCLLLDCFLVSCTIGVVALCHSRSLASIHLLSSLDCCNLPFSTASHTHVLLTQSLSCTLVYSHTLLLDPIHSSTLIVLAFSRRPFFSTVLALVLCFKFFGVDRDSGPLHFIGLLWKFCDTIRLLSFVSILQCDGTVTLADRCTHSVPGPPGLLQVRSRSQIQNRRKVLCALVGNSEKPFESVCPLLWGFLRQILLRFLKLCSCTACRNSDMTIVSM